MRRGRTLFLPTFTLTGRTLIKLEQSTRAGPENKRSMLHPAFLDTKRLLRTASWRCKNYSACLLRNKSCLPAFSVLHLRLTSSPTYFHFCMCSMPKHGCLLRQKPYMSAGPKGQASHFQGATCVTFAKRYEKHWKALSQPPVCILSCLWRSGCTGSWVYPKPERADCLFFLGNKSSFSSWAFTTLSTDMEISWCLGCNARHALKGSRILSKSK